MTNTELCPKCRKNHCCVGRTVCEACAEPRQLPIINIAGTRYFVDERLNELRNVDDPNDRETMHADASWYIETFKEKEG